MINEEIFFFIIFQIKYFEFIFVKNFLSKKKTFLSKEILIKKIFYQK